jgi:hypothetical protein
MQAVLKRLITFNIALFSILFGNAQTPELLFNPKDRTKEVPNLVSELKNEVNPLVYEDVRPIFKEYCNYCHYRGGPSPFALESYSSVVKRALPIKEALLSGIMPPWAADESFSKYSNCQALPDSSRDKLVNWLEDGILSGGDVEKIEVDYNSPYPKPDYSYSVAEEFIIQGDTDVFICTVIDPKFTEEVFATSIGFRSSNPEVVHHYVLYVDNSGVLDEAEETWECRYTTLTHNLHTVDAWATGIRFITYENGLGYRFKPGDKFLVHTHYNGYGNRGKVERGTIDLYTTKDINLELKVSPLSNPDIYIPANEVTSHGAEYVVKQDITLYGMVPHMHYLGESLKMYSMDPNGKGEELLSISEWNYSAQGKYMLETPLWIPKGTILCLDAVYNNTVDNPYQPNDPPVNVKWSQAGTGEMLSGLIYYSDGWNDPKQKGVLLR